MMTRNLSYLLGSSIRSICRSFWNTSLLLEPGSVRALDSDGLLPLQAACRLNFPDLVIHVLLRPYPGALLLL